MVLTHKKDASSKSKALTSTIVEEMPGLSKPEKDFIIDLLCLFMSMRGRHNFSGMERYGDKSERTYRSNFEREFDFLDFNARLARQELGEELVNVFDPSYIPKSGKHTPNLGKFWSGCLGKAVKGLEIGGLGVADVGQNTALHLEAIPTPSQNKLKAKDQSLIDHYAQVLIERKQTLESFSQYLAVDGYFSKKPFVDAIMNQTALQLISKLRKDAQLKYLYRGKPQKGPGRPKKYDGDVNIHQLDMRHFSSCYKDEDVHLFQAKLWSVSLKREIKVVYAHFLKEGKSTNRYALLFSTDLELSGLKIYQYYKVRFQIEFLFRDAKQFAGLTHCQARSENKLNFHFNTSLTAINVAKAAHYFSLPKEQQYGFSMADVKTSHFNELMLNLFLSKFHIDPNLDNIQNIKRELLSFGKIRA